MRVKVVYITTLLKYMNNIKVNMVVLIINNEHKIQLKGYKVSIC